MKPARGAIMRQEAVSLFLCYLLLFAGGGAQAGLLAAGLPALGFTSTDIAANSVAASLMSMSAVANGGGVPAGGLVATLQSLGTSGGSALMGKIGAFLGYVVHKHLENSKEEQEDEE
ncbi:interferon alpha-inducible protein 6 isoform X2 [Leptonychotes weddellii]|uniref:Interferon alpha-inducible protein 6 isoform X2 n=1 Tax=Leptonychotes weddellii TaxID=9713 RepID=A0A7F8Q1Q2_LEPWE|nr:interferon alpha-inducible protein 6 isoform X2 [Leptonychotes weddellii]